MFLFCGKDTWFTEANKKAWHSPLIGHSTIGWQDSSFKLFPASTLHMYRDSAVWKFQFLLTICTSFYKEAFLSYSELLSILTFLYHPLITPQLIFDLGCQLHHGSVRKVFSLSFSDFFFFSDLFSSSPHLLTSLVYTWPRLPALSWFHQANLLLYWD